MYAFVYYVHNSINTKKNGHDSDDDDSHGDGACGGNGNEMKGTKQSICIFL